jgi:uncharacterized membrane protein HdeD (DUF308 family)
MEKIKNLLIPLCNNETRVIVDVLTLWVGIPRLIPDASFSILRFADPVVYGILMTTVGVALLVTCYNGYSRTIWGKSIAGIAFISWAMLAAATASLTSFGFNVTIAILLLIEVYKNGPCK